MTTIEIQFPGSGLFHAIVVEDSNVLEVVEAATGTEAVDLAYRMFPGSELGDSALEVVMHEHR